MHSPTVIHAHASSHAYVHVKKSHLPQVGLSGSHSKSDEVYLRAVVTMSSIANDNTSSYSAVSSTDKTAYTGTDSGESAPPADASSSSSSSLRGTLRDSFAAAVSSTTAAVSQQLPGRPKNVQQQQHHRKLVVMDCRPKVNAMANKVKGGGVESVTRHSGKVS